MTIQQLLAHLRPTTMAQMISELIEDFAEEVDTDQFNFETELAAQAYTEILKAGENNCGADFWSMIEIALAAEETR